MDDFLSCKLHYNALGRYSYLHLYYITICELNLGLLILNADILFYCANSKRH